MMKQTPSAIYTTESDYKITQLALLVSSLEQQNKDLLNLVEKQREALEFYANHHNWIDVDKNGHHFAAISPADRVPDMPNHSGGFLATGGKRAKEALAMTIEAVDFAKAVSK